MNASTYTDATIAAHNALIAAGFMGRCRVRDIAAAGLLRELYACQDADLAKYDGYVGEFPLPSITYFYIFAAA